MFVVRSRVRSLEDREYHIDRLEFVRNQLNLLTEDIKKKIKAVTEQVESKVKPEQLSGCASMACLAKLVSATCSVCLGLHYVFAANLQLRRSNCRSSLLQVSNAMAEEICRLSVLINEFNSDFHSSPHVLKLYKTVSQPVAK